MSATGNWKITIATPMGPQEMTAQLNEDGGMLTGTLDSQMGSEPINGTVEGNALRWTTKVSKPMPLDLEFDATVEGDTLGGSVKLGVFGNAGLAGVRA